MRLLHVLSQLPDRTGSGIYLQSLVREAAARGHAQGVVAAANRDQQVDTGALAADHVSLVRFDTEELPFLLPGMSDVMPYPSTRWAEMTDRQLEMYLGRFEQALRAARARHEPQLVHVNHLWMVAALARRVFSDLPVIVSCHGTDLRQARLCPELAERVIPACRQLDHVLALTATQARQIEQDYGIAPARISVTGAGVNTALFHPPGGGHEEELSEPEGASLDLDLPAGCGPRVIYVGKLARAKGVESLLDAAQILLGRGEPLSLLLVGSGSGPETDRIRQRARSLAPAVTLMGHLPQATVAALLRTCDLFVLPSFYEGLPLSVAEALASSCRVVVSDLPVMQGWPDPAMVPPGALARVTLPPMRSVDQPHDHGLAAFARRLAEAISLQLGRGRFRSPGGPGFGWDSLFRHIEHIYREVLPRA